MLGDIGRQMFFILRKAIERTKSSDFQINAFATQTPGGFLGLMRQRSLTFVQEKGHQVAQFNVFPIRELLALRPCNELVQQTGVGALSVFRLTAFVSEVLEEVLNERLHGS